MPEYETDLTDEEIDQLVEAGLLRVVYEFTDEGREVLLDWIERIGKEEELI